MTEAAEEGAEPALAPMEQQGIERRAAVPQACLFERCPLIDAGAHQYDAGADLVGEAHRIRHEPRLVQARATTSARLPSTTARSWRSAAKNQSAVIATL